LNPSHYHHDAKDDWDDSVRNQMYGIARAFAPLLFHRRQFAELGWVPGTHVSCVDAEAERGYTNKDCHWIHVILLSTQRLGQPRHRKTSHLSGKTR
jgi:hypothetical protein